MTPKTYTIASLARTMALHIGKETEYGVRPVVIDVSEWMERWPEMVVSVHVTRPGEAASYPAVDVVREGSLITWTPNEIDTAIPGSGTLELMGLMDGRKILSATVALMISKTTTATVQEPPEGWPAWSDAVLLAGGQALEAAKDAAESAEAAQASKEAADASRQEALASAESAAASHQAAAESEANAAKSAELAEQSAAEKGWLYVEGRDDGYLYLVTSDNAPDGLTLKDDGQGGLVAVYG